jgi:hypothetical protein
MTCSSKPCNGAEIRRVGLRSEVNKPDPQRLGGLAWVRRTGGQLSRAERRRLLAAIALGQWENAVARAKLALGRLPAAAAPCANAAKLGDERADLLADGICVHTTPGVKVETDGTIGCYLQWGAMVDGAGLRIWDIAPGNVEEVLRRYPRGDFKRQLVEMMRAEAAAVPAGRFGLLVRCGLPLAVRMAPFGS